MDTPLTLVARALDGLGPSSSLEELAVALLVGGLSPRAARDWIHAGSARAGCTTARSASASRSRSPRPPDAPTRVPGVTSLQRDGDVFVLDLGSDENRFNGDSVAAIEACLDEVEAAPGPRALVTVASGKIWSNGLDLDWMGAHPDEFAPFLHRLHGLFARLLACGVPTVAALQGHSFAAGAMLALAHDLRVMRADRGFFCLPEVDIRIPFTPAMSALIQARLSPRPRTSR